LQHSAGAKDRINVAVTIPLEAGLIDRIAETHPRVRVVDISQDLKLAEAGDRDASARVDEALFTAEVMFSHLLPHNLIARAPQLHWLQAYFTGVDGILQDKSLRESPVVLTNMTGFHDIAVAEYVIETMLMFVKETLRCFQQKQTRRWEWFPVDTLESKTVGIVGYGRIGRAVCRVCKAFNMHVAAVDRTDRPYDPDGCLDRSLGNDGLEELLSTSDFVVVCVPLTDETRGIIGKHEIALMQPHARLIVVSRGNIVDEDALATALISGALAGAALDVYAEEPLPVDSPLWTISNLLFSPHNSGDIKDYDERATELFCRNLERYVRGEPLENVVDKALGF